jgi:hypothetical protein
MPVPSEGKQKAVSSTAERSDGKCLPKLEQTGEMIDRSSSNAFSNLKQDPNQTSVEVVMM